MYDQSSNFYKTVCKTYGERHPYCVCFSSFRLNLLRYDIVWQKHFYTEDDLRYEAESADDEVEVTVQGIRYLPNVAVLLTLLVVFVPFIIDFLYDSITSFVTSDYRSKKTLFYSIFFAKNIQGFVRKLVCISVFLPWLVLPKLWQLFIFVICTLLQISSLF